MTRPVAATAQPALVYVDPGGKGRVEIATREVIFPTSVGLAQRHPPTKQKTSGHVAIYNTFNAVRQ